MSRFPTLAPLAALAGAFASFSPALAADPPLTAVRVASGLAKPVYLTAAPGDRDRLFVLEQDSGLVRVVEGGAVRPAPFLDLSGVVKPMGEWGLLGLAFHPQYPSNGRCFVDYTREPDGAVVLARFTADPATAIADANSALTVLVQPQPYPNHNGGTVAFGPDGYLYTALGDGGGPGDPACLSQDLGFFLGKMLRLDVDSATPYAIPPGNPYVGVAGARAEIWASGLRNPYRFSFDRETGDLYLADVGQLLREEVNVQPAGVGGANYGWKAMEGDLCFGLDACPTSVPPCGASSYVDPIHVYGHGVGCSITGGAVYRGCALSGLQGTYFFGDYCSGRIWSLRWVNGQVTALKERTGELAPADGTTIDHVTAIGEDACGELYVVDHDGEVFRIETKTPAPAIDLGNGKVGGNGLVPSLEACGLLDSGHEATLSLRDAPPHRATLLVASAAPGPMPVFLGVLVPAWPPLVVLPGTTDATGARALAVPGGGGPADFWLQSLIDDPGASAGVGFSNAIRLTFLP